MLSSFPSSPSMSTHRSVVIFTWNPDWNIVKTLDLKQQIELFKAFVIRSQQEFIDQENESDAVCVLIAPDLIFSLGSPIALRSYNDFVYFCDQLRTMQSLIMPSTIVIAGSMDYLTQKGDQYKVTAPIISNRSFTFYDKKVPAGTRKVGDKIISMQSGEINGYIEFQNVLIGLEICQDHEVQTLRNTLHDLKKTVVIQVLISHGQCRRDSALVRPSHLNEVIFVHLELEAGESNQEGRILETANYRVKLKSQKAHHRFITNMLQPIELTPIETSVIESDDKNLSAIRYFTVSQKCKLDQNRDSYTLVDSFSSFSLKSEEKSSSVSDLSSFRHSLSNSSMKDLDALQSMSPMSVCSRSQASPLLMTPKGSPVTINRGLKSHRIDPTYFDAPKPEEETKVVRIHRRKR